MAFKYVVCLTLGILLSIVCVGAIENKDIERNVNILDFEMKMLKKTKTHKEAALRELKHCLSLVSIIYNGTAIPDHGINVRPIIRLLTEFRELSKLEKHLYGNIRRKLETYFPSEILLDGTGDSSEMLQSLRSISQRILTPTEDITPTRDQCDVTTFEDHRQWKYTALGDYPDNCSSCNLVLPNGDCVVETWQHLKYCDKNNQEIRRIRLPREPYEVAYYKNDIVLVESFLETAKTVHKVNLTSGRRIRPPLIKIRGRRVGSGLAVYDENVVVQAKSEIIDIYSLHNGYYTEIYKHHGRLHFKDFDILIAEAGSKYGGISGEILEGRTVLIKGSGEIICIVDFHDINPHISDNGFVTKHGFLVLPAKGNNKLFVFDSDCIPTGDVIKLPSRKYASKIRGFNDTLFITTSDSPSGWSNHMFKFI